MSTLSAKLLEKGGEQSKHLTRTFDQLLYLTKHEDGMPLNTTDFHIGITRLEKRALLTFTSKLFQEEEVRLRGMVTQVQPMVPDYALKAAVSTAIED